MGRGEITSGGRRVTVERRHRTNLLSLDQDPGAPRAGRFATRSQAVGTERLASKPMERRLTVLKNRLRAKQISQLEVWPSWRLVVNGEFITDYVASFSYLDHERNRAVVEDLRSDEPSVAAHRRDLRKIAHALHAISVEEVVL